MRRGDVGRSLFVFAVVALAGCSSAGGSGAGAANFGDRHAFCSLMTRLDRTGAAVEHADVKDPAVFDAALDRAVKNYVAVVDDLHDVAPRDLDDDLERLRAAVEQYRFADGVDAHAALDAYASRTCT